ncbi:MAG: helix-turn-helix domain-containing protein [Candidatus Thiodiazotropha sp.]|jgi:transcriptional regulator GlxA family with amidase domain
MKIGLLLYTDCMPAGLFAFADLLESANKRLDQNFFELLWVSHDLKPVRCSHGNVLTAQFRLEDSSLDALLVPGLWGDADISAMLAQQKALIDAIMRLDLNVRLWSYCTGVSLIAASGKLNGKKATITWWMAEQTQMLFPKVDWQLSQSCVFDGKLYTASGANGYLPICLELIEKKLGEDMLREISKLMVLPHPERDYLPFQAVDLVYLKDKLMRRVFVWVEQTPVRDLGVANLARHLNMSERSLARKVKAAVGQSCAKFMEQIKHNQASEQLVLTMRSAKQISADLGYADDTSFRRAFKRVTGYTPGEYRQKFKP